MDLNKPEFQIHTGLSGVILNLEFGEKLTVKFLTWFFLDIFSLGLP
jgi:hypothetical protein